MSKENNRGLIVLVVVLSILVLALSSYLIYDKVLAKDKDANDIVENNQDNELNPNELYSKFVGKYEYDGKEAGSSYHKLEILSNGTYTYSYGMHNGSGYNASGNYSISANKIYLFNDKCNIAIVGNECMYPNCDNLIELNYSIINNEINISDNNIKEYYLHQDL